MDKLKDIKDIVEIENFGLISNLPFSFLFSTLLVISLLVFICFLVYDILNKRDRKRFFKTQKEIAYENLKSINYDDTKDIAYKFSQNYLFFADETNSKELELLELELYDYKYKKEVEEIKSELKERVRNFTKGIKC